MKFSKNKATKRTSSTETGEIIIYQYDENKKGPESPMGGALAILNGTLEAKENNFTEMFYVIEGSVHITEEYDDKDDESYVVEAGDMCIIDKGVKHSTIGNNAKVFIACSPSYYTLKNPYKDKK